MVPSLVPQGLRRPLFVSFFLILPLCAGFADARAQAVDEVDVFTVEGVAVDATAQTAAAARETALARGQSEALDRLMSRLTLRADAARLARPSAAELGDLVRGIEVEGEKTSSVRYIADLRVRFRADGIRGLLRRQGIPFAETRSKPMVVLPVLETDGGPLLWEQVTEWREAWSAVPRGEGLVPLIVPLGDLADLQAIDAERAAAGDTARLNAIAGLYNAGDVIVAQATPQYAGESVVAVQVSINRFSALGQDETLVESFRADAGGQEALWARAAAGVAANIEEAWKRGALIRYDSERSLTAVVPLAGINDLVEVRRRLANVAILRRAELVYLARNEAQFRFDFFGDERQLASAFAQNDLILEPDGVGWRMQPRGASGRTSPSSTAPALLPPMDAPAALPDETVIVP